MVRLIFGFPIYQRLISELLNDSSLILGDFVINRFPNKELYIRLGSNVANKECLIFATIAPPDENLISCLLLAHTLKKEGAKSVELIVPYLSYTRQDKIKPQESLFTDMLGKLFEASGVDEILTVDVHSPEVSKLFPIPVKSILPDMLWEREIKKLDFLDATFVAPDKSALKRVEAIIKLLELKNPSIAFFEKERTSQGVRHLSFQGNLREKAIIIDDMLDTGETLVLCAQELSRAGVKKIVVMVTHGLFTEEKWLKLFDLNVEKIYCTNTVTLTKNLTNQEKIEVVDIAPLVSKYLKDVSEKPRT